MRIRPGFTIVELLIAIVIIGILAAITIVAYNGITTKAREAQVISDLKSSSILIEIDNATNGSYPSSQSAVNNGQGLPEGVTYTYNDPDGYCITSSYIRNGATINYYLNNITQTPALGSCPITATTMQALTTAMCNSLPIYTGTNGSEALVTLTDPRGADPSEHRTYTVGKLADNNCWMLDNLKLGSTTTSLILTPADSDVASNFTLPQVINGTGAASDTSDNPGNNYDTPYAYYSTNDNPGNPQTNYGYYYNFSAATAGETRTSLPAGTGDAAHSICPSGWHLPTGRSGGEFFVLDTTAGTGGFGGTGANQSGLTGKNPWLLQDAGPFRGLLAGFWGSGGFVNQGSNGYLWSGSAYSSTINAWTASFSSSRAYPGGDGFPRNRGLGVRCLLN